MGGVHWGQRGKNRPKALFFLRNAMTITKLKC